MDRKEGLNFINLERHHARTQSSLVEWLTATKSEKWQVAELILELCKNEDEFLHFIETYTPTFRDHLMSPVPSRTRRPTSELPEPISPNLALMIAITTQNNVVRNEALSVVLKDPTILKSGFSVITACCLAQDIDGMNRIFDSKCWGSEKELVTALNEFVASAKDIGSSDGSDMIKILKRFADEGVRVYDAMIFDVPIVEVFLQKGLDNVAAFISQEHLMQVLDDSVIDFSPEEDADIDAEILFSNSL